jgi:hypothetical protein
MYKCCLIIGSYINYKCKEFIPYFIFMCIRKMIKPDLTGPLNFFPLYGFYLLFELKKHCSRQEKMGA